jgi:hypothetical protein
VIDLFAQPIRQRDDVLREFPVDRVHRCVRSEENIRPLTRQGEKRVRVVSRRLLVVRHIGLSRLEIDDG